jgi:hypothetical protein
VIEVAAAPVAPGPPLETAPPDAIAAQVDHDLNDLTNAAEAPVARAVLPGPVATEAVRAPVAPPPQSVSAVPEPEEDPADFLLEALPGKAAPAAAPTPNPQPAQAMAVAQKPQSPQMSTVLAAIATELLAESHADERARPLVISGALALLMSMSEEERIALFS